MKLRAAVSVLALAAALTACSSSSKGGGPTAAAPTTGGAVVGGSTPVVVPTGGGSGAPGDFCANLTDATSKLAKLPDSGASGDFTALKTAIDQEVAAFQELGNGAPDEVKPAIADIVSLLQQAEGAFANPGSPDVTKLQGLATQLPNDLTALDNYIGTKCIGG